MSGRPPKPLTLVEGHLTKHEKSARKKTEAQLTANAKMRKSPEVRQNKAASAHFNRLQKLYAEIGMCDGLCEQAINRYCLLLSRHSELMALSGAAEDALAALREMRLAMEPLEYIESLRGLMQNVVSLERAAAKVRDQLLAIERENLLTLQGKLRAVPKKAEKEPAKSGFSAYREKYGGVRDG